MTAFNRNRRGNRTGRKMGILMALGLCVLLAAFVLGVSHLVARFVDQPGAIPRAYAQVVERELQACREAGWPIYEWRFDFGFVDGDDIPELLVCEGNSHADRVRIYSYNPETDAVVQWGEFGETGGTYYGQKQGIVVDSFGGQGVFYTVYHQGGAGGLERILSISLENGFSEVIHYYWRTDCDGADVEWLHEEIEDAAYEVTEEEFYEKRAELWNTLNNVVRVEYSEMYKYTPEALYSAYKATGAPAELGE